MITNKTVVTIEDKKYGFHIIQGVPQLQGDFGVNIEAETIKGVIISFLDDTISNNYIEGVMKVGQVTPFIIEKADLSNILKTVQEYFSVPTFFIDTIMKAKVVNTDKK